MKYIVIVDIDGTTCDSSHRGKRLVGKPYPASREEWAEWEEGMENDPPIQMGIDLVHLFMRVAKGLEIVFVTAREECTRSQTTQMLKRHFHPDSFTLWMRDHDDRRASAVVKLELITKHVGIENVYCCIEDEIGVAKAFRKAGMYVLHVSDPLEA